LNLNNSFFIQATGMNFQITDNLPRFVHNGSVKMSLCYHYNSI